MDAAVELACLPPGPPPAATSNELSPGRPVGEPLSAPLREFLVWVAFRPRTYTDVMDAWQSHCPRFTLWEDALETGLVELEPGVEWRGSVRVRLTACGRAALGGT